MATYGLEITGAGQALLVALRRAVAAAASPGGCGRHYEATLYALDAGGGTLGFAFRVHVQPIAALALAVYEKWLPPATLKWAIRRARSTVLRTDGPQWQRVKGPVGAAVATAARIGWQLEDDATLSCPDGRVLDLHADSPAAISAAVIAAVRQWRLRRLAEAIPHLLPAAPDIVARDARGETPPRKAL